MPTSAPSAAGGAARSSFWFGAVAEQDSRHVPAAHLPVVVGASAGDDVAQVATRRARNGPRPGRGRTRPGACTSRPAAASSAPIASSSCRAPGEDEHDVELGQLPDARELPSSVQREARRPCPHRAAPPGPVRQRPHHRLGLSGATSEHRIGSPAGVVADAGSWPVRRGHGSGPRPSGARRRRSPRRRGGRTGRGTPAVGPAEPVAAFRSRVALRAGAGDSSRTTAAASSSARIAVARSHSSRSISVVTLCGRPRRTVSRSPGRASAPSSRPASPSIANPAAAGGMTRGTIRTTASPRSSDDEVQALAGRWSTSAASRGCRSLRPRRSSRRRAAAGRASACATWSGTPNAPRRHPSRRTTGHHDGARPTAEDRRTGRAAPSPNAPPSRRAPGETPLARRLLRMIVVMSKKSRPAASWTGGGPATGSTGGWPYRRATEEPITRIADRPIGVSGRVRPCARLKQK